MEDNRPVAINEDSDSGSEQLVLNPVDSNQLDEMVSSSGLIQLEVQRF
jgi:hypothetical protein